MAAEDKQNGAEVWEFRLQEPRRRDPFVNGECGTLTSCRYNCPSPSRPFLPRILLQSAYRESKRFPERSTQENLHLSRFSASKGCFDL